MRMAEPISRPVVLPVPRCVRTKVPQEVDLWPAEEGDRAGIAGLVSATRSGTVGRARAAGPGPHVPQRSAEVQCCAYDRIYQREKCSTDTQTDIGKSSGNGVIFLGPWVLCEHSRFG